MSKNLSWHNGGHSPSCGQFWSWDGPLKMSFIKIKGLEFLFFNIFYWSIVDTHCWVNFCYTTKWFYIYIYIHIYISHYYFKVIINLSSLLLHFFIDFVIGFAHTFLRNICIYFSPAFLEHPLQYSTLQLPLPQYPYSACIETGL